MSSSPAANSTGTATLVTCQHHPRSLACQIVADLSGVEILTRRDEEPRLVLADGRALSSPAAAAFKLSGSPSGLLANPAAGSSPDLDRAEVLDCLFDIESGLWPLALNKVFGSLGLIEGHNVNEEEKRLATELERLNVALGSKTYLACERFSVADVWAAVPLALLNRHVKEMSDPVRLPHLCRWMQTVLSRPEVSKRLQGAGFGTRMFVFVDFVHAHCQRTCLAC